MRALHDCLLHNGLISLQLNDLFLHVVVLSLLFDDAALEFFEIGHDIWVNHFDVLVVLR